MTGYLIFGLILAAFAAPLLAVARLADPPRRRQPLSRGARAFIGVLLMLLAAVLFPVVAAWILGTLVVLGAGAALLAHRYGRTR
jgi:hypothetical protein